MGHRGKFLGEHSIDELQSVGLEVIYTEPHEYAWQFDFLGEMVVFFKLLFGIDKADHATRLKAIQPHLGFTQYEDRIAMNWEL